MTIRRGFEVKDGENYVVCEDIITTGGSALEAAREIEKAGGNIVAYAALANRGFCSRVGSTLEAKSNCKLPLDKPLLHLMISLLKCMLQKIALCVKKEALLINQEAEEINGKMERC